MKNWNKGRFARVAGAMGAAMLMVVAPTAAVGPVVGSPAAHAQEHVPVPTREETESEVVVEEEPAPAPAPAPAPEPAPVPVPAPAPAEEPVPVPREEDAPESDVDDADAEEAEENLPPAPREFGARMARTAVRGGGVVSDPALIEEFGLQGPPEVCVNPPGTMWISSDRNAWEINTDGTKTGRTANLGTGGVGSQFGSGIAVNQSNTILYGVNYNNRPSSPSRMSISRWDVSGGAGVQLSSIPTGIQRSQLGTDSSSYYRVLNSLSMSNDGRHLYVGAEGVGRVWRVDVNDSNPSTNTREVVTNNQSPGGWGGDFVRLSNGWTLGAKMDGRLVAWNGDPAGAPTSIGRIPEGLYTIQGLAVVDGIIYLVDGFPGSTSSGLYRLPADFVDNFASYNSNSVHNLELVMDHNNASFDGQGFWDLTSAQESMGCPPPPTMEVDKRHGDNAVSGPNGEGNFEVTYQVDAKNTGSTSTTYSLFDKTMFGDGIEIVDARWNGHATGGPVSGAAISAAGGVRLAEDVSIDGNATHTYNVTVKFKAPAADYDRVRCEPGNGLFNRAVVKDGATGSGHMDDDCLPPPELPTAAFEVDKMPSPGEPVQVGPDGTARLEYTVTVKNTSGSDGVTPEIWDRFWVPEDVRPRGATIKVDNQTGVTGMPDSWTEQQILDANNPENPALKLADSVELAAGASRIFTIFIQVSVDVAEAEWEVLGTCAPDPDRPIRPGAPNTVFMDGDVNPNNNDACIPLLPPRLASLSINKVGLDSADGETVEVPLDGALFDLYPAGEDGLINTEADPMPKAVAEGDVQKWENLAAGKYYLVETRSPVGYELLPQPVGITITGTDTAYGINVDDRDVPVAQPVVDDSFELVVQVNDIKTGNLPLTGPADQAFWYALAAAVGLGMVMLNLGLFRRER